MIPNQMPQLPMPMPPQQMQQRPQPVPLGRVMKGFDPHAQTRMPGGRHIDMTMVDPARAQEAASDGTNKGLPGHRLEQFYNAFVTGKREELLDALKAEEYYHGKQWSPDQKSILNDRKQPATYFNELRKKVDSYIGIEQRLRRDPKGFPASPKHEGDSDAATAALRSIGEKTQAQTQYSEAGRDFFVRGIGVLYQGVQRNKKGKVEVCKKRVPAVNFVYDPRSMEWDFADAKFIGEWGWHDAEDAEDLFIKLGRPDSAAKMRWLQGNHATGGVPGELARVRTEWFSRDLGRVRLIHMYYKHRGQWWYAIICGQVELYNAPSIYRDEDGESCHPYVAASCYVDERGQRYGVVKDLIPIQDSINQRHSRLFHLLAQRRIIADRGAVDDINKTRREAARADAYIELNPRGKDGIDKRFKIDEGGPEIEGQYKLLEHSIEQMRNYGPNTAILGKGEGVNSQSGRAILALQNAGMTEMSSVFDRHRLLKFMSWRADWRNVRQFWDDERWFTVMDEDAEKGVKFVALNRVLYDPTTGQMKIENSVAKMDIDIIIDESADTITQTEEALDFMSKLGEAAVGPAGELFIELSNLRNKDRLLKLIRSKQPQTDPQQAELARKVAFLEAAQRAADVDKTLADVEQKRADALSKLVSAAVPSSAMQIFPFDYGARSTYEDFLGEDIHPNGNAFELIPSPPQLPQPMDGGGGIEGEGGAPPASAGAEPPQMPEVVQNGFDDGAGDQWLPGDEPQMGDEQGLPMPPAAMGDGGLMPPPGTRPN